MWNRSHTLVRMATDHSLQEIARLRGEFEVEPRGTALRLAQRLSWHSMELALEGQRDKSELLWEEALDVARLVLDDPTQFELTELIRISIGTARTLMLSGRVITAGEILDAAEDHYAQLAELAVSPTITLALRGSILHARAELLETRGEFAAALDVTCEATLELLAGSEANPLIVKQMMREPLRSLGRLLDATA